MRAGSAGPGCLGALSSARIPFREENWNEISFPPDTAALNILVYFFLERVTCSKSYFALFTYYSVCTFLSLLFRKTFYNGDIIVCLLNKPMYV